MLYLPSYAQSNGLSPSRGALLLALMSIAQVLGQQTFGYLSDRGSLLDALAVTSTLVASVAAYACWNLGKTFPVLAVFALLYGFFGAGYTALWGRMGTKICLSGGAGGSGSGSESAEGESLSSTSAFMAFAMLNLGKGVGNVLAGPISGALLTRAQASGLDGHGRKRYESIILFTGTSMAVSGATIVGWYLRPAVMCRS
jgi:hypothetical protein